MDLSDHVGCRLAGQSQRLLLPLPACGAGSGTGALLSLRFLSFLVQCDQSPCSLLFLQSRCLPAPTPPLPPHPLEAVAHPSFLSSLPCPERRPFPSVATSSACASLPYHTHPGQEQLQPCKPPIHSLHTHHAPCLHTQTSTHRPGLAVAQVIRLFSIACVSPEATAPATAPLRKRFVEALLDRGLLKLMADIKGDYDNTYMHQVRRADQRALGQAGGRVAFLGMTLLAHVPTYIACPLTTVAASPPTSPTVCTMLASRQLVASSSWL